MCFNENIAACTIQGYFKVLFRACHGRVFIAVGQSSHPQSFRLSRATVCTIIAAVEAARTSSLYMYVALVVLLFLLRYYQYVLLVLLPPPPFPCYFALCRLHKLRVCHSFRHQYNQQIISLFSILLFFRKKNYLLVLIVVVLVLVDVFVVAVIFVLVVIHCSCRYGCWSFFKTLG